jgi:hypothetical protein
VIGLMIVTPLANVSRGIGPVAAAKAADGMETTTTTKAR